MMENIQTDAERRHLLTALDRRWKL